MESIPEKLKGLLKSAKFWGMVFGLVALVLKFMFPDVPIFQDDLTVQQFINLLIAFILGSAAVEAVKSLKA